MEESDNCRLVLRFCERLSARDFDHINEMMAEDAAWWAVGLNSPTGMDYMIPRVQSFLGEFDTFRFDVTGLISEKDIVVVEATSHGEIAGRRGYDNTYLIQFHLKGGKIAVIKEYFDQSEVQRFRAGSRDTGGSREGQCQRSTLSLMG